MSVSNSQRALVVLATLLLAFPSLASSRTFHELVDSPNNWKSSEDWSRLAQAIGATCVERSEEYPDCGAPADVKDWCRCFTSTEASPAIVRDFLMILKTAPLRQAYLLSEEELIDAPLQTLAELLPPPERKLGLGPLDTPPDPPVSSSPAGTVVPGGGSVMNVDALVQRVFDGLALTLQKRAEQEAAYFVLVRLDEQLCSQDDARHWLPSTCATTASITESDTGIIALGLLRQAVEADLRRFPTRLAETGARALELGIENQVADLIDRVIDGESPIQALNLFSSELNRALRNDATNAARIAPVSCGASFPASLLHWGKLMGELHNPRDPGVTLALLALSDDSCLSLYPDMNESPLDALVPRYEQIASYG